MKPVPIRIDRPLMNTLLRERANAALVFGERHANALAKLLAIARRHGQVVDVALLSDGKRETLIAHVPGAGPWSVVK
ncbi:hypothetical protein [Paraburkholderia flagellata]|uniref:hypothetical protein n=1 Tax=Paraburkholderia flagellata TaxID=2883241 RepID=UPI001F430CEF|nr:hypothetical protein [Paraburkholderia flagellata]